MLMGNTTNKLQILHCDQNTGTPLFTKFFEIWYLFSLGCLHFCMLYFVEPNTALEQGCILPFGCSTQAKVATPRGSLLPQAHSVFPDNREQEARLGASFPPYLSCFTGTGNLLCWRIPKTTEGRYQGQGIVWNVLQSRTWKSLQRNRRQTCFLRIPRIVETLDYELLYCCFILAFFSFCLFKKK